MDNCRISWGMVIGLNGATLTTKVKPLVLTGNNLTLGDPEHRQVMRQINGQGFVDAVRPGDWISIHWGWACQVLNRQQVANLERWTQHHLEPIAIVGAPNTFAIGASAADALPCAAVLFLDRRATRAPVLGWNRSPVHRLVAVAPALGELDVRGA